MGAIAGKRCIFGFIIMSAVKSTTSEIGPGVWSKQLQGMVEQNAFGVCTMLGEKLGIATASIRLWFIYASFLTFGSPVVLYFGIAFLKEIPRHLRRSRATVWDF